MDLRDPSTRGQGKATGCEGEGCRGGGRGARESNVGGRRWGDE